MTVRVMLVSPEWDEAQRRVRFDGGAHVDPAALRRTGEAVGAVPASARCYYGASARCRETAAALGLHAEEAPELRDLDVGSWRGRTLDEVAVAEPDAVGSWLAQPDAAPHGGESLVDLIDRVGGWLDGRAEESGRIAAVVERAVARAVMVRALGLPAQVFWRLDVEPLSVTELSGRAGRWNLRCGRPLGSRPR